MKKAASIIGIIILLVLLIPAVLPSKFSMSRSIQINAPVSAVFANLEDLNTYPKWNAFSEGDVENKYEISGTGVGAYLHWKGGKTGEGRMTFTEIESQKKIAIKMDFFEPMPGQGLVHWLTHAKGENQTEFVWTYAQDLTYFKRYFGLFMEAMMGKHFEKGLLNFKNMMETAK
jgi:hypothetical protein